MNLQRQEGSEQVLEATGADGAGIWSILLGVVTAPGQAFAAFNRKPSLLVPLIIAVILMAIVSGAYAPYQTRASYEVMKQSPNVPPEILRGIELQMSGNNFALSALTGGIWAVIITVIVALIAWMIGNFFFGGTTGFKKVWGVTLLGGLIVSAGKILMLPLVIAKDSIMVSLGPAALYPAKSITSIFYVMLMYLDVFAIWSVIVTGIGYAAIYGFARGKGITISVIVTVISMAVMLGFSILGMSFAGMDVHFF